LCAGESRCEEKKQASWEVSRASHSVPNRRAH
jgi:hypothetical protein